MEPDQCSLETGKTHVYNEVINEWKETLMKVVDSLSLDSFIAQNCKMYFN